MAASNTHDFIKSKTYRLLTGCGALYLTVAEGDNPIEALFAELGKSGTCAAAFLSFYCSFLKESIALGIPKDKVVDAFVKASGQMCQYGTESCIYVMTRALTKELKGGRSNDSRKETDSR